jgi:hypothetical protein
MSLNYLYIEEKNSSPTSRCTGDHPVFSNRQKPPARSAFGDLFRGGISAKEYL